MKTLVFFNRKGGTGKTTISVAVAGVLSARKKKVLFIDTDSQGNASSQLFTKKDKKELVDVLEGGAKLQDAIQETEYENLFLLPTFDSARLTDFVQFKSPKTEYRDSVNWLFDDLGNLGEFDYAIIDMPPSESELDKKFLVCADEVVPVLELDQFSMSGYATLYKMIMQLRGRNQKPQIKRIVYNKIVRSRASTKQLIKKIQDEQSQVKPYFVPTDTTFVNAQLMHSLPTDFRIRNESKEVLVQFADDIS